MSIKFSKEVQDILVKLNGEKSTILDSTLARLYVASPSGPWSYTNLSGVLCLVLDRSLSSAASFIRLFHPETFELLFECELYYYFASNYIDLTPCFYYFQVTYGFIGILFPEKTIAEKFKKSVIQSQPKIEEKEFNKIYKEKSSSKSGGFFSKIKGFFLKWELRGKRSNQQADQRPTEHLHKI